MIGPMNAFDMLKRIRGVSPMVANLATNHLITYLIPLARGLDVRVREVTDTRCELTMPVSRRTRNHVKSMYIGAQMTLADLTVGMVLFHRFPPGPFGGVIKRAEADYRIKAKGTIRAICDLPQQAIDDLEQSRTSEDGKAEAWVPVQLVDGKGQVVTDVRFLVAVKRFGPPA